MLNVDLQPEWQSPTGELQACIIYLDDDYLDDDEVRIDDELPFFVIAPNKELENETL